ncbi:hypothetical protein Nepgr_025817 [Nepenthes gracilis]|uniref:Uncharacterized protein n=1 Tax=Nepenthes gracilis TaxID=150966 RepID=A0AAD3T7S8_NEPGR|nr:hypothetical protein Nepgr_025817 [Nepenthes gracilis]
MVNSGGIQLLVKLSCRACRYAYFVNMCELGRPIEATVDKDSDRAWGVGYDILVDHLGCWVGDFDIIFDGLLPVLGEVADVLVHEGVRGDGSEGLDGDEHIAWIFCFAIPILTL